MFVSINDYLGRICHTLENVIAPDLETDFARSQVYAVIALLGSLGRKVAYKTELISNEINAGTDIIETIAEVLKGAAVDLPADVLGFMTESKENSLTIDIKTVERINGHFRQILDVLYAHKGKINPEMYDEMDKKIRTYIHDISLRDVGFMPAMSFDKILKSGKE